ncbi:hypothetical protein PDJAM_G00047590 [Pangasius djambal]|uniref:Uncharacterized protein n=1 Tax=Pangasius djambal TaxID=1691987 RepID=A0ACC5YV45_9TELE|nr:hypothetical protein [Pangasius djambal]
MEHFWLAALFLLWALTSGTKCSTLMGSRSNCRSGILQDRSAFAVLHMPTIVMPMVSHNTHKHNTLSLHKVHVWLKPSFAVGPVPKVPADWF